MNIHINDLSYSPIVLKKGDKGDKIKKIHQILSQLGYNCDEDDNVFGLKTYNMIIKLQLNNKIKLTGNFDENTQNFIFNQFKQNFLKNIILPSNKVSIGLFNQDNNFSIIDWENKNWNYIIRAKNSTMATNILNSFKQCYSNYNICFSNNLDNSFYNLAKKENMNFSNISLFCNTNDIELIKMCCIANGISEDILNYSKSYSNFVEIFKELENDFFIINSYNYTNNSDYLRHGDILISDNCISIVMTDGPKVNQIAPVKAIAHVHKVKITANKLIVRSIPSREGKVVACIKKDDICTIIEEKQGWGKLKSCRGWIDLNFVERL